MFEIKVTPDTGKRYTLNVEGQDLQATLKELSKMVLFGRVVFVTVKPIREYVGA